MGLDSLTLLRAAATVLMASLKILGQETLELEILGQGTLELEWQLEKFSASKIFSWWSPLEFMSPELSFRPHGSPVP